MIGVQVIQALWTWRSSATHESTVGAPRIWSTIRESGRHAAVEGGSGAHEETSTPEGMGHPGDDVGAVPGPRRMRGRLELDVRFARDDGDAHRSPDR